MLKRNLYLNTTPVEEALTTYLARLEGLLTPREEAISTEESLGRVTSCAVYAAVCSPLFNAAAMDGIAVVASTTDAASESCPLRLIKDKDFTVVDTGDPIHSPWDAVIMAEDLIASGADGVELLASAAPWQHVRPIGEDIVTGELLVPSFHKIRSMDIGVLLSGGVTEFAVFSKPTVAILPTGSELIEPGETPGEGAILESNSHMLAAMITEAGGLPDRLDVVPDDQTLLEQAILAAVRTHELVLVNAGSSAGIEDFTAPILRKLGEVVLHGVAMKPGKPVILAVVAGRPVVGLPGYPVSSWLACDTFVMPLLTRMTGLEPEVRAEVDAVISRRICASLKHREYVRVKVGRVGKKLVAAPLERGAGAAMSLVRADGFCVIPQNSEGVEAGESMRVRLLRSLAELEHTVVCVGSHDLSLDVLADLLASQQRGAYLSSTHVGSLAGLMALCRGEAHMTPTHLLDEDTGVYNLSWIKRLFPGRRMALVKGVERMQGFLVQPGNPLGIRGIADLPGKRYVNRQRGAGTRVLLDYRLRAAGISPETLNGYGREAATHMAVAAAVQSGGADVGLGVYSAAKALGLDFVPLAPEEYDFALPAEFLELSHVRAFLETLQSPAFHARLEALGGYFRPRLGEIILIDGS